MSDDRIRELARLIDRALAGSSVGGKPLAWSLLIWPDGETTNRVSYVSNVSLSGRDQVKAAIEALLQRWDNNPDHNKGELKL